MTVTADSDKRYQVFVSSTYLDLRPERRAVVETLLEVDAFPAGMELFPATDEDAWTLIEDVISDSDYYLLIVGGKYGSVDPALEISYTEREYDTAVRLKKPVMAFLHGQPEKLTVEASETDPMVSQKLSDFREKVRAAKHVKFWTSPEDLAGKVARTWNTFTRRYPATGWVRANQVTSRESLQALQTAHAEIERLRGLLDRARTEPPSGTADLAQGSGKVSIPVSMSGTWRPADASFREFTAHGSVDLSWDRIFGFLGLSMMHEAEQADLHERLDELIEIDHDAAVEDQYLVQLSDYVEKREDKGEGAAYRHDMEPHVHSEHFQNILLQLRALGLIRQSERSRSVKDTGTYWTLTPFGQTRLDEIRALRTGDTALAREVADEVVDEGAGEGDGGVESDKADEALDPLTPTPEDGPAEES